MKTTKQKRRQKQRLLILAICILGLAVSTIGIYDGAGHYQEYQFEKMRENGTDILKLYEQNHDLVGWIQVPNTNIDYPVMNSEKYLFLNFEKKRSRCGTPFIDENCTEKSLNTLIYAHNMWYDKTMFTELENYQKKSYWEQYPNAIYYAICTDVDGSKYVEKRTFEIMSVIRTETTSWPYWGYTKIETPEEVETYISECKERQEYDTGVNGTGKVLTLSTCSYHVKGKNGRLVVVGTLKDTCVQNVTDKM